MKKMLILLGVIFVSMILVACGDTTVASSEPVFKQLFVEDREPSSGGALTTFYKGKNDVVLLEIHLENPNNLTITNINIGGYNYRTSRFTEDSTNSLIFFYIPTGSVLGEKVYTIDYIEFLDGDSAKSTAVSSNNQFKVYVYKNSPTVTRESYAVNQHSISVDFLTADTDNVVVPGTLIAQLFSGETLVRSIIMGSGQSNVLFDGLLSNKNYSLKIIASFNLDDSHGLKGDVVLYTGAFLTLNNSVPIAKITNPVVSSNSISFYVTYTDVNNVTLPSGTTIGVYAEDVLVDTVDFSGSGTIVITNLLNDNDYTLKVLSDYDLGNGHASYLGEVLFTYAFSTSPRSVPEPVLSNFKIKENRASFEISINDPDGLIDQDTLIAKIYVDGILRKVALLKDYTVYFGVEDLFSNYDFLIEIEASYDLNDGLGVQTNKVIFSEVYTTLQNIIPIVNVTDIIITQGYVTVGLNASDVNKTLQGKFEIILFENDIEVDSKLFGIDALELVFQYQVVFGKVYRIEIIGDYNLRDGLGLVYDENLYTKVLTFLERKAPAAELNSIEIGKDSIKLNAYVMDSDSTFVADSVYINIYLDGALIDSQLLSIGTNPIIFNDLSSNSEYEIIVVGDYDLVDGTGVITNQEIITGKVLTEPKTVAVAEITDSSGETESLMFDIRITDIDVTVVPGTVIAKLYLLGEFTGLSAPLVVGTNYGVTFEGALASENYEIRIYVDYDLNDGEGVVEDFEMVNVLVSSLIKTKLFAIIYDIKVTSESVSFNVRDTMEIRMFDENDTQVGYVTIASKGVINNIDFLGLWSNYEYYIEVIASYDDGEGNITETVYRYNFKTLPKLTPAARILNLDISVAGQITFEISDTLDNDEVVLGAFEVVLLVDNVEVSILQFTEDGSYTFYGYNAQDGRSYTIVTRATVDLNDANGTQLLYELFTKNITTVIKILN